ncbi:glycine/betaine ABC transporter ATP-binding protein, partial [Lysinibacillus sp. BF-4]
MREEEVSLLIAVDRHRNLRGYITADDAREAAKQGSKDLVAYLQTDIKTVEADTLIQDVFNVIYDARTPVAVVKGERLLGVIIRGVVIEALAKTEEVQ